MATHADMEKRVGQRWYHLTVLAVIRGPHGSGRSKYLVRCDCGRDKVLRSDSIFRKTGPGCKSCGCKLGGRRGAIRRYTPEEMRLRKIAQRKSLQQKKTPEEKRAFWLWKIWGMREEEYDAIYKAQNCGCAICGKPCESDGKKLAIDHNHKTGVIRGLLCRDHNQALGVFHDNPQELQKAIDYLNLCGNGNPIWGDAPKKYRKPHPRVRRPRKQALATAIATL